MNKLLLFLFLGIIVVSCDKDDPIPEINFLEDELAYDSGLADAPQLPRGLSYTAVRYSSSDLQRTGHIGREILGVDFWIRDVPDAITVIIHRANPNSSAEPGQLLYEATLPASQLRGNSWNNFDLDQDIEIPSQGFWVLLEIDAGDRDLRVTGCDPGPRHPNGDVFGLFGQGQPGWTSFFDFSGDQVSINWNIRTILKPA